LLFLPFLTILLNALGVDVVTQSGEYLLSTGRQIKFEARTYPAQAATSYIWYLTNNNNLTTYHPSVTYVFSKPNA